MKKIFVLIVALLSSSLSSSVYSLCTRRKSKEMAARMSLSLYSCGDTVPQRKWIHTSHASHYSCVDRYKHSITQTKIKDVVLDSTQVAMIKSLWEWKNEKGLATLQRIEAEVVHLDSIDSFYTNDEYFKVNLVIRFMEKYGDVDMQSHQYYIYYISKDKDLYYLYREEAPSRSSAYSLKEFPKLKQTIDIIKE